MVREQIEVRGVLNRFYTEAADREGYETSCSVSLVPPRLEMSSETPDLKTFAIKRKGLRSAFFQE